MKEYSNEEIRVLWKPEKCIHAAECIRGLPDVFCKEKTPWIDMKGAGSEEIIKVIDLCPSGALSYEKLQKESERKGEEPCARIRVTKDGPLLVDGPCSLHGSDGLELAGHGPYALCRCGKSAKKPFCDGTHLKIGFKEK